MLPRLSGLLVFALLALSCGELPNEARPAVVLAVFDPSRGEVPSPNDLALVDGKVAIAERDWAPAADNELKQSLNGRDGFSTGSSTKVKFSAPLSAATLSKDSVVVLDLGRKGEPAQPAPVDVLLDYSDCDHGLEINSATGFLPGHTYLFAVRGGATANEQEADDFRARGVNGEPVVPSPAFHFLKAGKDLRQHPNAFPGTREEKLASAEALEQVRQSYEPLFQILEEHGLPRRDVAILWTMTTQTGAEAIVAPAQKRIPMPNDLLRDPVTGRVTLPIDPSELEAQQELKRGLNQLDGFSTTSAFTLEFTQPLKFEDWIANQRVRVFRADTMEEKTDFKINVWPDGVRMSIEPETPLQPNTQYVVVVAGLKDTAENAVTGMPLTQVLKLTNPLVADGQSTVSSLCLEQAQQLEPLRAQIQPVLDQLAADTPRESISAVWTFKTLDILSRLQALWETPYKQNLPLAVTDVEHKEPWTQGFVPIATAVEDVIYGKMTTWDYLDPVTTAFRENGQGVQRQIEFVMTIPEGYPKGAKIPIVVFGHGLLTERRLGLLVAEDLAGAGYAMMAIDFPLHGERSICKTDDQCEAGATCAADHTCRKGGQPADFARVSAFKFGDAQLEIPTVWGRGTPSSTGATYVDLEHMVAARDHMRQTVVDVSAQIRLVREMDWTQTTGGWQFDPEQVMYAGISLGGITGANMSAADPHLKRMLLNVGGGGIVELLEDSASLGTVMKLGLQEKGITPERGDAKYEAFRNAGHWVVDEVDPVNLIPFGNHAPRSYVDPKTGETKTMAKKALRLQMAIADAVVPNTATRRMLKASKLNEATSFREFVGHHGFLADPLGGISGRNDMVDFLEGKK